MKSIIGVSQCFLVPTYGFENPILAGDYQKVLVKKCDPDDLFERILTRRSTYVPRPGVKSDLSTAMLSADLTFSHKPQWITLRSLTNPKPDGAYNVALLVEGPRKFYRHAHHTTKHPSWWYRITEGWRDCYGVWARSDGSYLTQLSESPTGHNVYVGRYGRGVLYGLTAKYANNGQIDGYRQDVVLVEFSIMDRDPGKDDMVRLDVRHGVSWLDQVPTEAPTGSDQIWTNMLKAAFQNFMAHCQIVPPEVEHWRFMFLDQEKKLAAESKIYDGTSFKDRISKLDFQKALELVEQPWELVVVINVHAHDSRFWQAPGNYIGSNSVLVANMLEQYQCTSERREFLERMVGEFVAPRDNLWNYCGD